MTSGIGNDNDNDSLKNDGDSFETNPVLIEGNTVRSNFIIINNIVKRLESFNVVLRILSELCVYFVFGWYAVFFVYALTKSGKEFYDDLSTKVLNDVPIGRPILNLSFTLLAAASLCHIIYPATSLSERGKVSTFRIPNICRFLFWRKNRRGDGDPSMNWIAFIVVFLPCLGYMITRSYPRHIIPTVEHEHFANDFGKVSMMSMSWFLVPVSRHCIILSVLGWDPIYATQLHTAAGYFAVVTGLIHGIYYIVIWYQLPPRETFLENTIPAKECWDKDVIFGKTESHSCYLIFMNSTGVLAATFFIILTVTSLWWVRRKYYKVFYLSHIIFGTLVFLSLFLHYNQMILYICPSILYYAASTGPFLVQSFLSYIQGGTKIVNVEHIGDCVELSFHVCPQTYPNCVAALNATPTQYVRICVPELSSLWHPFTIYSTMTNDGDVKFSIIFRQYGTFTTALSSRLRSETHPKILVDGFYSGADRLSQALNHDTVLMVAGGIGIVSYMSLLTLLHSTLAKTSCQQCFKTKKVVLLWVCREEGLIEHILGKLSDSSIMDDIEYGSNNTTVYNEVDVQFQIIIHHTAVDTPVTPICNETLLSNKGIGDEQGKGVTFVPAKLSLTGKRRSTIEKISSCAIFFTIVWGGVRIIWYYYDTFQDKHRSIGTRIYSICVIMLLSFVVPLVVAFIMRFLSPCFKSGAKRGYDSLNISERDIIEEGNGTIELGQSNEKQRRKEFELDENEGVEEFNRNGSASLTMTKNGVDLSMKYDASKDISVRNKDPSSNREASRKSFPEVSTFQKNAISVKVEHLRGRPVINDTLNEIFEASKSPGVFLCGPHSLLKAVKTAVCRSSHSCGNSRFPPCAIYEECFEV